MKKIISMILVLLAICALTTVTVSADAGPKSELVISLTPAENDYYAGLLYDRDEEPWWGYFDEDTGAENEVYKKLKAYEDADGYVLSDEVWCVRDREIKWNTFHSPGRFKILVYSPHNDRYSVAESDGRQAMYIRYTVNVSADGEVSLVDNAGVDSEDRSDLTIYAFISLIITVLVELLIGLCFRFTKGRQILTIIVMNIITLPLMTGLIYIINPPVYGTIFSFPYAFFEIGVTVIEAVVYCILLPYFAKEGRKTPMWLVAIYTVVANLATYAIAAFVPCLPAMILMLIVYFPMMFA